MYIVLYSFVVKSNREKEFVQSWKALTELIYKHEGSLGSRLHKEADQHYIAYAQWPDKSKFENSGHNLPDEAEFFRKLMRESCKKIEIVKKLEVVDDKLRG
ncbi:antibiotic biosynthesis monooxygenase [Tamlana sp. 2201CG12-4]|uniref:antibiotic biosynthesis monooxygenase family protein n=1 Tax=Tamlana sp. 2201CG12-4 TaxID=3112582 RepID=UPI002DBE34CD|nr:antibiotic biosynthesis monooxygenase [Tamlana sp. 2201CG12-4]MEC3906343.1 antibiotic biosynthesis monooxygenase [Tamlana sp. 2201CG12-4]